MNKHFIEMAAELFVSKEEGRPILQRPFYRPELKTLYSTNSYILFQMENVSSDLNLYPRKESDESNFIPDESIKKLIKEWIEQSTKISDCTTDQLIDSLSTSDQYPQLLSSLAPNQKKDDNYEDVGEIDGDTIYKKKWYSNGSSQYEDIIMKLLDTETIIKSHYLAKVITALRLLGIETFDIYIPKEYSSVVIHSEEFKTTMCIMPCSK